MDKTVVTRIWRSVLMSRLSHVSLRDPNSVQTLSAFRKGVDWAKSGQFSQQDIDEAKLSVFSAVDSPVAPSSKGETPPVLNEVNLHLHQIVLCH